MGPRSLKIGTFFGIQLRIHASWLIVFVLVAWSVITGYLPMFRHDLTTGERLGAGLIVTILFFISVIAHEYAHSLVAKRRGLKIKRITLFLFGGGAELQHEPDNAKTEFLMTVAGPLTSLLIAGLSWLVWLLSHGQQFKLGEIIAGPLAVLNLIVGIFNLLPAYPLDGGRILRALIWLKSDNLITATKAAASTSYVLSYFMMALGLLNVLGGAIVSGVWLGFLGIFLHQLTQLSYAQTVAQVALGPAKVEDVMSDQFAVVPAEIPVSAFLGNYVLRYKYHDFLVISHADIVGVISLGQDVNLREADQTVPVSRYMLPLSRKLKLSLHDPAAKALRLLQQYGLQALPVFDHNTVLGIVAPRYLDDYMNIHRLPT